MVTTKTTVETTATRANLTKACSYTIFN